MWPSGRAIHASCGIDSAIVRNRSSLSRSAASARSRPVTSRVKQRVWTNSPPSRMTLESIRTSLTEPSLHRSRAG